MPRRKLTTINLQELDCYAILLEELQNNPDYANKDFSTLKLTVLDSYEATIKEVDKAIKIFITTLLPIETLLRFFKANKSSIVFI